MSTESKLDLELPAGFRSQRAALFLAQMDDQLKLFTEATRDLTPDELEWQPKPGTNTIGMLLAHMAIVETWWTMIVNGANARDLKPVLGIDVDDDGMPIPEDGSPPANLARKEIGYFDDLLARARAHTKDAVAKMTDEDLVRVFSRTRPDGTERSYTVRWYLYHISEHFSGHYGQILLLRHLYRIVNVPARA